MPVSSTCNEALNDIINSVPDRSNLWGIRFKIPRAFYVHVHSYIISQLTIQLITDDKLIFENGVWMKLQGLIFG